MEAQSYSRNLSSTKARLVPGEKQTQKHTFASVREYLDDIPYINSGGCGIAALSMYRWLLKNEKVICYIKFYHRSLEDRDINQHRCSNNLFLRAPAHVTIEYMGKDYDSRGAYTGGMGSYYVLATENELVRSLNYADNWNDSFERYEWVDVIEEELEINLGDIRR